MVRFSFIQRIIRETKKGMKNTALDYRDTLKEIKDYSIAKPKRAAIIWFCIGSALYLIRNNPSQECFNNQVKESYHHLLVVHESQRNPVSVEHISFLNDCVQSHCIKRLDLGIFSLLFRLDCDPKCALYTNTCDYLQPSYTEYLTKRLLDIGIAGRYRFIEHKMIDYDVNPAEWEK